MADVRVRGAVSAKSSNKKRHKMVVTDDKVRVGRTAESGSGDGDEDDDDDFDDADDVDGDFDDADNADVEAAGAAGAVDTGAGAAPAVTGAEASTGAEVTVTADASDAEADEPADEPANEPAQEGVTPMAEQTTPSAIVRPLHDRILVKRLDAEQKTPGGLFIPDNAKEKPVEGLVVAVGNGVLTKDGTRVPLDVKAGDRVLFSKYSGNEVKIALDGGEHLILREDDILAVLEIP